MLSGSGSFEERFPCEPAASKDGPASGCVGELSAESVGGAEGRPLRLAGGAGLVVGGLGSMVSLHLDCLGRDGDCGRRGGFAGYRREMRRGRSQCCRFRGGRRCQGSRLYGRLGGEKIRLVMKECSGEPGLSDEQRKCAWSLCVCPFRTPLVLVSACVCSAHFFSFRCLSLLPTPHHSPLATRSLNSMASTSRELFGGAITAQLPQGLIDAS